MVIGTQSTRKKKKNCWIPIALSPRGGTVDTLVPGTQKKKRGVRVPIPGHQKKK